MRGNFQHLFALLLALIASFTVIQLASAAIFVTRAELNGDELRLEGEGAVPDATILVDGTPMGRADDGGEFRIEEDGFSSPTCVVTVSDGSSTAQATLEDCTPSMTNTPAPSNTPENTPAPTSMPAPTNTPLPTNTPAPTNTSAPTNTPANTPTPTNTPVPTNPPTATSTPGPTNTPAPTNTLAPTNTPVPTATATTAPGNQPPVADAGADQTVEDNDGDGVETVTLDGSGSSDTDGSIVSYEWRQDSTLLVSEGNSIAGPSTGQSDPLSTVRDRSAAFPQLVEPGVSDSPDFMLESNQPDPQTVIPAGFGGSTASAGDVNGDGFEDIIVGAPGWDGGDTHEGAAFVFLGSANGITGSDPATAHAHIESNQQGAQLGTVAGAGDVNGDGFDDIIVGAHFYDSVLPGTNLAVDGAAFVFHGGPQGITGTDPATADASILGNELNSDLGLFVSSAGDVNGDGFDDVIVGVPNHGTPFPSNIPPNDRSGDYGAALLFYGSPAGITGTGFDDAGAVLLSYEDTGQPEPPIYGRIGAVAGAGDVNGDGYDDVVLGGSELALFLGSVNGIPTGNLTTADARVQPDRSSLLVAPAGDVNGDDFADIMASSPFRDLEPNSTREEGVAYVFLGGAAGIAATDTSQAHATFTGSMLAEWVGLSISGAGDVDNDGYDDVLVGAHEYPGSLESEGVAYLFRGSPQGISGESLLDADSRLEVRQSMAIRHSNVLAFSVDSTGDVNGDGFDDVIVGKGYYDNGELEEGAAFVYLGQAWPANPNQPPVANAGADQVVVDLDNSGTEAVSLDGRASFDPDGTIVSYAWYKGETLLGTTPALQTELPFLGDQELVLVVTDDQGVSRGDPVTVRVEPPQTEQVYFDNFDSLNGWATGGEVSLSSTDSFPTPPQAHIGSAGAFMRRSITLPAGTTGVQLRFWAKASQFAAGDEVRVNVSADGGPFSNMLTLTSEDSDGSYHFYGGSGAVLSHSWYPATASNIVLEFESATTSGEFFVDELTVHALIAPLGDNQAPVAAAGPDQTVNDEDGDGQAAVVLDGSASSDPDGTIVSYQWHEGDTLLGESASLATDLALGEHVLTLTVTDNEGLTAVDTVLVTVIPSSPESQITLALPLGVHTIELMVTDDDGATATDTVVVTVEEALDTTPEATLSIDAPSSVERGDFLDISMTVMNTGTATLQNVTLTIGWSPSNRLKDLSDPNTVSLGDIAPGQSATFTWNARADRQGSVEISGTAATGGTTLDTASHTMQIRK